MPLQSYTSLVQLKYQDGLNWFRLLFYSPSIPLLLFVRFVFLLYSNPLIKRGSKSPQRFGVGQCLFLQAVITVFRAVFCSLNYIKLCSCGEKQLTVQHRVCCTTCHGIRRYRSRCVYLSSFLSAAWMGSQLNTAFSGSLQFDCVTIHYTELPSAWVDVCGG